MHPFLSALRRLCLFAMPLACVLHASPVPALDYVVCDRDGKKVQLVGRIVATTSDRVMLMSRDGALWDLPSAHVLQQRSDNEAFIRLPADALGKKLLEQLPPGYETHATAHYLIVHNTSKAFAQWCGSLFERLHTAFMNYWPQRGIELHQPAMPMVVVIFADKSTYLHYMQLELNKQLESMVGYYNIRTNRVMMYDITGVETLRLPGDKRGTTAQINHILSRPKAAPMVSTLVHEATHQLAYNSGLHERFADIPLWFAEGLAMYFESPDLSAAKGWRTLGEVNENRLRRFRQYLPARPSNSLLTLMSDEQRFRNPNQMGDAYAEAWAFHYFLLRQRPQQYKAYLQRLADKEPLVRDGPEGRLKDFAACFGSDLRGLEQEFLRYTQRVR